MANTGARWQMQHESGTTLEVSSGTSLSLAAECGYQWVNKQDGEGWRQVSLLVRAQQIRTIVGIGAA